MVLHGCLEQGSSDNPVPWASSIERDSKFDDVADQERFIVVYPNHKWDLLSPTLPLCWEFWEEAHGNHRGQGDVADLAEIVKEVQKDYKVDPNRIHIAGLSSGAAMTVAALVAYPDVFASGSPTAGVPYGETEVGFATGAFKPVDDIVTEMKAEMDGRMRPVPIFIIQSEADDTVKFQYAENIRDSWGKAFGVDMQNPVSPPVSDQTKGTSWTDTKYGKGPDGNTVVETLILHRRPDGGLKHGWYGGGDGQFAFSNAPNTAQLAWEFFKAHPLPAQPSGGDTPR
jgi:poly(hydroxyalkanoate) depolymerase family esterase